MYKTGDYYCYGCEARFDLLVTKEEYDQDTPQECPQCGKPAPRVPGTPMIGNVSLPDGTKRFCKEKEWSKLNKQYAETPYQDKKKRAELKADMDKLKPTTKK